MMSKIVHAFTCAGILPSQHKRAFCPGYEKT